MSEEYVEEADPDQDLKPVEEADLSDAAVARPEYVPEKFWDAETGNVRVEALANSYAELEHRLSAGTRSLENPADATIADSAIDEETVEPAPYEIDTSHGVFEPSTEIDSVLREAGFTQDQAQLVYDLAAHVLMPVVSEITDAKTAGTEEYRLQQYFGGDERWQETRRQLRNWGKRHLPEDAYDALSSTYDGVLSLYRLMHADEPSMLRGESVTDTTDESSLRQIIRDPRYWRDRDTALVRRVSEGFRRLYPDGS